MSNVLSPGPKQQFFDNNGRPAVGYKLFTYEAGTTTKLDTYVSESGAANTNPIILDYRGECNVWIPPNVSYKYVLARPSDSDPPTAPIWTVDDVVSSQLITLYGGVDTGSTNAYVLNFDANFSAYQDGIIIYWVPSNTNTGASTLNVNGLGALNVVNPDGTSVVAGALLLNQMTAVILQSGEWVLLTVSYTVGSFTGTVTGMTTTVTGTVDYKITGGICTLYITGNLSGTSNATTMTLTGLPALVRPSVQRNILCSDLVDNGISVAGLAGIGTGGSITFGKLGVSGANVVPAVFTGSGTKGIFTGWTVVYPL